MNDFIPINRGNRMPTRKLRLRSPVPLHRCSSDLGHADHVRTDEVLPRPDAPFAGKIGLTYKDSTPVKPKLKVPETFGIKDAPNMLIVLIDDCGFGQCSTFGGGVPTPNFDRIANSGLRVQSVPHHRVVQSHASGTAVWS